MALKNVLIVHLKLQIQPVFDVFEKLQKNSQAQEISEFTHNSKKSSTSPWFAKFRISIHEDSPCFNC